MKTIIMMTSITYASKAQKTLKDHGISSKIISTPKNTGSGCGYSIELRSNDDVSLALKILSDENIKYKGTAKV